MHDSFWNSERVDLVPRSALVVSDFAALFAYSALWQQQHDLAFQFDEALPIETFAYCIPSHCHSVAL